MTIRIPTGLPPKVVPRPPGPERGRPDPRPGPTRVPTSDTGSNTVIPQSDEPKRSAAENLLAEMVLQLPPEQLRTLMRGFERDVIRPAVLALRRSER